MKCFFCKGSLNMGVCIMCGRSDDIERELKVRKEQRKPHRNLHTNSTDTTRIAKLRMKYAST